MAALPGPEDSRKSEQSSQASDSQVTAKGGTPGINLSDEFVPRLTPTTPDSVDKPSTDPGSLPYRFAESMTKARDEFGQVRLEWGQSPIPLRFGKLLAVWPASEFPSREEVSGLVPNNSACVLGGIALHGKSEIYTLHEIAESSRSIAELMGTPSIKFLDFHGGTLKSHDIRFHPFVVLGKYQDRIAEQPTDKTQNPDQRALLFRIACFFQELSEFINSKGIAPGKLKNGDPDPFVHREDGSRDYALSARTQLALAKAHMLRLLPVGAVYGMETGRQFPPEGSVLVGTIGGIVGLAVDCVKWTWVAPKALIRLALSGSELVRSWFQGK